MGVPDPSIHADTVIDETGRLTSLRQRDWSVSFSRYAEECWRNRAVTDQFDGSVVETLGAIDVTATWINGSTFVSENGFVDLESTVGDIAGGSVTSKVDEVILNSAGC